MPYGFKENLEIFRENVGMRDHSEGTLKTRQMYFSVFLMT